MAEYSDLKKRLSESEGCQHSRAEIRRKETSNGTLQILRQCIDCGDRVGEFLPRKSLELGTSVEDLPEWDTELQMNGKAAIRSRLAGAWKVEKRAQIEEKLEKYRQYLASPEWRSRADLVLERDKQLCQSCRQSEATQVHHLSYDHLYEEPLYELVAVCVDCHQRLHPESEKSLRRIYDMMISAKEN